MLFGISSVICLLAAANNVIAGSSSQLLAFTSPDTAPSLLANLDVTSTASSLTRNIFKSHGVSTPACDLDAIVLVSVDGLERSTFSTLRHATPSLRRRAMDAPSQITFEILDDDGHVNFAQGLDAMLARKCSYRPTQVNHQAIQPGDTVPPRTSTEKVSVIQVNVEDLRLQEELALDSLVAVDEAYPQNLVVIFKSSSPSGHVYNHTLSKRQLLTEASSSSARISQTKHKSGIFSKYQLFSTPMILIILIVIGLLGPITIFAVSQLANIQVPDQIGIRKEPVTGDKKTQ